MNADGSNQIRLVEVSGRCTGPVWSPDGKRIAFAQSWEGTADIFAYDLP